MNDTPYSSRDLYLNSDDADRTVGDDTNFCVFFFKSIVDVPPEINISIKIKDAQIPVSFSNVNSNTNTFVYSPIGSSKVTTIITDGNYTSLSLRDKFNTDLSGIFTITYDSTRNKYTITKASGEFTLHKESGLIRILGFTVKDHISSNGVLISDSIVDLSGLGGIFVQTNFITANQDSKTKNLTSILQKIPINQSGNGVVFYNNKTDSKSTIFEKSINELHIRLLDEDQNLLAMNNGRWRMTISLDFTYQNKYRQFESREQLIRRLPVRKKKDFILQNNITK